VVGLVLIGHLGFLAVCLSAPMSWILGLIPMVICWFVQRDKLIRLENDANAVRQIIRELPAAPVLEIDIEPVDSTPATQEPCRCCA
jgi:hypothetical protein